MTVREEATPALAQLALRGLHESLGARFAAERGVAVPADYGDREGELESMRTEAAVVDLSWLGRLELRGRDRHRFLNGLVTSNVKDLAAGRGVYGFVVTKQGRVLADVYVTAIEDRLWLELPAGTSDRVRAHLEAYRVIDDVEVLPLDDLVTIGVFGPGAAAALGPAAAALEPDAGARALVDGTEVELVRRRLFGVEGFALWAPASLGADLFAGLAERALPSRRRAAGLAALETLRIEAGVGRWGVDFGEETVANETGLVDRAIDFTKGCYLGQEIVARIHYRGQPSAVCTAVEVTGRSTRPAVPCAIRIAGETAEAERGEAGRLTSVTPGVAAGAWLGVGPLSRRALAPGTALELEGGGVVRPRQPSG